MMKTEQSAFRRFAFDAGSISPLPKGSKERDRVGDELQPIGTYANSNPYYRTVQDVEALKERESHDPDFAGDDWWWDHHRIRFLNGKLGFKILLMFVPFVWGLLLWVGGLFMIAKGVFELTKSGQHSEFLNLLVHIGGLIVAFGWIAFVIWVGPSSTKWLMNTGVSWFLKPFEKSINSKLDQSFEDSCSEFNRLTGQVRFAMGRKRFFEAPFVEFDAYAERVIQHGGVFYRLMFVHRYTQKTFNQTWLSGIEPTKGEVLALWDMLQRYMDVTEPLPDMPRLEPFRHLDPVTRDHDSKTNRNPRYWRDLDLEAWKAGEGTEMLAKQNRFPWAKRQCKLTPHLGKVSMAEYRELRPEGAWPI
ncbi:hypothetical protein [Marinobacter apostichopi]|uniref:hypothetical protein n=1 Tax=Marinobacter apostichopi TaxID=3035454 RepID=UPI002572820E|nr:hypothetical protein [Marinobacter sp. LA51]